MKRFINKTIIFFSPFIFLTFSIYHFDVLKVYKSNYNYFSKSLILINRELLCTRTFEKHRKKQNFNSFILGSSRSQAFKCQDWKSFIDSNNVPFHFDGYGAGLYNVTNQLEYIDRLGDNINNVLIIIDREFLKITENRKGHLFISPPCLSGEPKVNYFAQLTKLQLSPSFLKELVKNYKKSTNPKETAKYEYKRDTINCDVWYSKDEHIKYDSIGYYSEILEKNIFYKRPKLDVKPLEISDTAINQLIRIKKIFIKHNTNYKIIIAPNYDQIKLEKEYFLLLQQIFKEDRVFDYSGKNNLTEPLHNFYETSHFRPHVARKIMSEIYKK